MKKLQKNIDYHFKNIELLKQALTHRSLKNNNERLEFLGDSLLSSIISYELYQRFPKVNEGELTRLRARLVRGQTLAKQAQILNLADVLILGKNELKSGTFNRDSVQADAFEAILGSIFLDSDYLTVKRVTLKLYKELLNNLGEDDLLKDFKSQLQEFLQKKGYSLPIYKLTEKKGEGVDAIFYLSCNIKEYNLTVEKNAKSIKKAEHACAESILKAILSK